VQCVFIASCKRAFSVQNLIKTRVRNRLGSKNFEAMLRIALDGPNEHVGDIVCDVILLWKNDSKYGFLYANPTSHLNARSGPSASDVSCSASALNNGTNVF